MTFHGVHVCVGCGHVWSLALPGVVEGLELVFWCMAGVWVHLRPVACNAGQVLRTVGSVRLRHKEEA